MTRPIAVIGATGQIATTLQRLAKKRGAEFVVGGRPDVDITSMESVAAFLDSVTPSIVINAAAYTEVDKAQDEGKDLAFSVNAEGPSRLAVLCAVSNIPLVHISTDYVFNGLKGAPYVEEDELAPLNLYGASKAAAETGIRAAGGNHIILRTQWVYGPNGSNFAKTMLRLGQERDEVRVVNDQIGAPTSSEEIAEALLDICATVGDGAPEDHWGTFHMVAGGMTTWYGFAAEIFRLAHEAGLKTPKLTAIGTLDYPTSAMRPPAAVLATDKLQKIYGIEPKPWDETLARIFPEILASMSAIETAD